MPRPEFITKEDIARWDTIIDSDIPSILANNLLIKEACYAGQWLGEQLQLLGCPADYEVRIVYTAGKLSYGRDPWDVSFKLLKAYESNELEYEKEFTIN